ncbi:hypothetical protein P3T76_000736 [Phytophthora citrophthora]|uniref:YjeF N-terminal domain-containing protein n=1 Tax=Phytophthora citrophthora TaxID=4793 RepID=A0AAD9H0S1_9STRA|nr:hypothetical protein P3T76_000736 [Phytophthora citrophthora]
MPSHLFGARTCPVLAIDTPSGLAPTGPEFLEIVEPIDQILVHGWRLTCSGRSAEFYSPFLVRSALNTTGE